MTTIRQFCAALRKDGFKFCWRDRSGGIATTQFAKRIGEREVNVQLWADGKHRASHWNRVDNDDQRWHGTTLPTYFDNLDGMKDAITREFAEAL